MNYIIDFERINSLSSNDNTRKLIKQYMDIYQGYIYKYGITQEQYDESVEILRYNKILLDKSDIRDNKMNKLL